MSDLKKIESSTVEKIDFEVGQPREILPNYFRDGFYF